MWRSPFSVDPSQWNTRPVEVEVEDRISLRVKDWGEEEEGEEEVGDIRKEIVLLVSLSTLVRVILSPWTSRLSWNCPYSLLKGFALGPER